MLVYIMWRLVNRKRFDPKDETSLGLMGCSAEEFNHLDKHELENACLIDREYKTFGNSVCFYLGLRV